MYGEKGYYFLEAGKLTYSPEFRRGCSCKWMKPYKGDGDEDWKFEKFVDPNLLVQEEENDIAETAMRIESEANVARIRLAKEKTDKETSERERTVPPKTKEQLEAMTLEAAFGYILSIVGPNVNPNDNVREIEDELKFQGFDPLLGAVRIMAKKIILPEGSKKHDILYMIVLGHQRGNNLKTLLSKSMETAKTNIDKLVKNYKLVASAGDNIKALTLSRVSLCFSQLSCSFSQIARFAIVPAESVSPGFPAYMACSAFPSLIPTGLKEVTEDLKLIYMLYQVQFSRTINKNDRLKGTKKIYKTVLPFVNAAVNSRFVAEDRRLREQGFITVTDGLAASLKPLAEKDRLEFGVPRVEEEVEAGIVQSL